MGIQDKLTVGCAVALVALILMVFHLFLVAWYLTSPTPLWYIFLSAVVTDTVSAMTFDLIVFNFRYTRKLWRALF